MPASVPGSRNSTSQKVVPGLRICSAICLAPPGKFSNATEPSSYFLNSSVLAPRTLMTVCCGRANWPTSSSGALAVTRRTQWLIRDQRSWAARAREAFAASGVVLNSSRSHLSAFNNAAAHANKHLVAQCLRRAALNRSSKPAGDGHGKGHRNSNTNAAMPVRGARPWHASGTRAGAFMLAAQWRALAGISRRLRGRAEARR